MEIISASVASSTVYLLCGVTSSICAVFLMRKYLSSGTRLLLWSAICFGLLALNNILLVLDLTFLPEVDLSLVRTATAFAGMVILVGGFIWEAV